MRDSVDFIVRELQFKSRKGLVASILVAIIAYMGLMSAIKSFDIGHFARLPSNAQLPASRADGVMIYRKKGIYLRNDDGDLLAISCRLVDYEKYPGAIPCGKERLQHLEGVKGTVWYWEKRTRLPIIELESVDRLAVQIHSDEGHVYPFETQKQALRHGRKGAAYRILLPALHLVMILLLWCGFFVPLIRKLEEK